MEILMDVSSFILLINMLKMCLKSINLNYCILYYIDHLKPEKWSTPIYIHLAIASLLIQLANIATLNMIPMDDYNRLLHADVTLFWQCDRRISLLPASMFVQIIYLFYIGFYAIGPSTIQVLQMVRSVLYEGNCRVFLPTSGVVHKRSRLAKSVICIRERIQKRTNLFIQMVANGVVWFVGKFTEIFSLYH